MCALLCYDVCKIFYYVMLTIMLSSSRCC